MLNRKNAGYIFNCPFGGWDTNLLKSVRARRWFIYQQNAVVRSLVALAQWGQILLIFLHFLSLGVFTPYYHEFAWILLKGLSSQPFGNWIVVPNLWGFFELMTSNCGYMLFFLFPLTLQSFIKIGQHWYYAFFICFLILQFTKNSKGGLL